MLKEINLDPQLLEVLVVESLAKVFSAFRHVHVFLTTTDPSPGRGGGTYTHVLVCGLSRWPAFLGIACFQPQSISDLAVVQVETVVRSAQEVGLDIHQISNLLANTLAHEIGHTLGLGHSEQLHDVMHDGLDHHVHSLMPPVFHTAQINAMNLAIHRWSSRRS
ncbi:MAG: hypothetical protein HC921_21855 [Synechococcaceae cyanobacterium SM2_3_1]|nr:hypothetical protein [Synechococcaceae cyanobacterium SM2_3_1]